MPDDTPQTPDATVSPPHPVPQIRAVTYDDVRHALSRGFADFCKAPAFGLFFGAIYALGGLLLVAAVTALQLPWLSYPLIIGFSLIGPFIAVGLYEVSRRLETGQPLAWNDILSVVWRQRHRELGWMAFVMLFIFWIWLYQVRTLIAVFLGFKSFSTLPQFLEIVFTTPEGWMFLAAGHVVGAAISLVLFTLTVVSCPLLLERDVDFVTAMITSVKAVFASPVVMIGWGIFVVLCVVLSAIPAFAGFLISLPVLGHATWHLYRRAVEPLEP